MFAVWIACSLAGNSPACSDDFETQIKPLLINYCSDCHSGDDAQAGVDFESINSGEQVKEAFELWESVIGHLKAQTMPPEDELQPTAEQRASVYQWYHEFAASIESRPADFRPRRLSVVEYRNTLRSVIGFDLEVAVMEAEQTVSERSLVIKLLPLDPPGESGFKNDTHGNPLSVVSWDQYSFLVDTALEELFSQRRQSELAELSGRTIDAGEKSRPATTELNLSQLKTLMGKILTRAYRRPADQDELDRVMKQFDGKQGDQLVVAVKHEIKAALMSARFLYRGMGVNAEPGRQPVDQFELAERLSYFL